MHLIIDRKILKDQLETVSKALGKNDSEPICTHFLLRVGPTVCEILAGGKGGLCGYTKADNLAPTNVEDGKKVGFTVAKSFKQAILGVKK